MAFKDKQQAGREIPSELRPVLISIGRGLGTVSVYGTDHPSVDQIVDQAFGELQVALKDRRSIALGTHNGSLTLDEEPVIARDVPVRTLEKRLVAMKVSHLTLHRGLTESELKTLLSALCAPNDERMKESLSEAGLSHVEMADVKYVALKEGEKKAGPGSGEGDGPGQGAPSVQVNQIVAFLKGSAAADSQTKEDLKEMLSDPERLGKMILEAASIRQSAVSVHDGESMADIVVGCLRRTYGGLRKEAEFKTPQGKVNLNKAMMLLEKSVMDKIHRALGAQHPEIDRRIFDAIREMEEEQEFEMLTAHYLNQKSKIDKVEERVMKAIKKKGAEKAREQFEAMGIPPKDWQKLMVQAGEKLGGGTGGAGTGLGGGVDMSALAVVLEKIEGLMQIDFQSPEQALTTAGVARSGIKNYTDKIEARLQELEGQVQLQENHNKTVEDHAEHLTREDIMLEVSKLTMALIQPLTVVNASVEAAMRHVDKDIQKELLTLATESGRRMQSLTTRMMNLVGYPTLDTPHSI